MSERPAPDPRSRRTADRPGPTAAHDRRGRYVALEGIEGAGKSTVARRLVDAIASAGIPVELVREPGGTPLGEGIRSLLLDPDRAVHPWAEALLFAAQRAQLVREVVEPALASGTWVISDRTAYSSLAYQGIARGLGLDAVRAVNDVAVGGRWPDLVIVLDVPVDRGMDRQEVPDRIGSEGAAFQRAVAAGFARLAREEPERFAIVDADRPLEAVVADVLAVMTARLGLETGGTR